MKPDLRTPYCEMIFKRSAQDQMLIRQRIVRHAQQHGVKPTARKYGCTRQTIRTWKARFAAQGTRGLANKSRAPHRCPHKISKEMEEQIVQKRQAVPYYGPKRLKHFNPSLKASEGAIYRVLKEQGLIRRIKKKYLVKQDLRAVKARYRSLTHHQEDVKHLYDLPHYWSQMKADNLPKYEYTMRDTKSGFTILGFANEYSEQHSTIFTETYLGHLKHFGVEIKEVIIQTDNGGEFGAKKRDVKTPGFVNTIVQEFGATHQYIPPGMCNANADVESFHSTVEREFFNLETFGSRSEFFRRAQAYQLFYNFVRPNYSKGGKPPLQIMLEDLPSTSPRALNFPVYDLDALFRQKMELPVPVRGGQYVHKLPEAEATCWTAAKSAIHPLQNRIFHQNNRLFDRLL